MQQEEQAQADFAMMPPPSPMPQDFASPLHHGQHPPEQHGFAPAQHEFAPPPPPQFDIGPQHNGFDGPPMLFNGGPPPPPAMMDQFTAPPQPGHYLETQAPQGYAPPPPPPPAHAGNGAHSPFNGFDDPMPPMGEHGMPPLPPAQAEPFEPNPLLAALANERPPESPPPMFAPQSRPMPAPPRLHTNGAANGNGASNGAGNGAGNGAKPAARRPDFSGLPPAMAESLAKLAGMPWPPEDEQREIEAHAAGHPPGAPRREG
jgi:hypothetical protein